MSDLTGEKKKALKELIEKLHAGAKPEEIKERFKEVLKDVGPTEMSQVEEELIKEGMPREQIQKLCEVHLAVFRESLEREDLSTCRAPYSYSYRRAQNPSEVRRRTQR
jgi:DUF438 domain-containing protein